MNYNSLVYGCDVGRFSDRTALIGLRQSVEKDRYLVSSIMLLSNTPLPMQAKIIRYTVGENPLYLDVTGLGIGLGDLLPSRHIPVSIIAGVGLRRVRTGPVPGWRAGKARLLQGLASSLRRLSILPSISKSLQDQLKLELRNMQVKPGRVEKYGARSGTHDDLVLALSLALLGMQVNGREHEV